MIVTLPPDPTLDELRDALAPIVPHHAGFDGWGETALARAAEALGIDPAIARLAFPGGAPAMIDAWFGWVDAELGRRLPPERLVALPFRARIRTLLVTRLEILAPDREAVRRALAVLALPQHLTLGVRLGWRAADAMWRLAGDTATDFNHYSKRATLSLVYAATLSAWLADDGDGSTDISAFIDRRIEGVMRFERVKAGLMPPPDRRFNLARFLGRLRYPPR